MGLLLGTLKPVPLLPQFWPSQTTHSYTLLQIPFGGEAAMLPRNAVLTAPRNPKDCFQIYQVLEFEHLWQGYKNKSSLFPQTTYKYLLSRRKRRRWQERTYRCSKLNDKVWSHNALHSNPLTSSVFLGNSCRPSVPWHPHITNKTKTNAQNKPVCWA